MVSIILDQEFSIKKEDLFYKMQAQGISCRPFFFPLSTIPAFFGTESARKARERNVVSYKITPYGLNLPCGMNMDEEKVRYVCDALNTIIDHNAK